MKRLILSALESFEMKAHRYIREMAFSRSEAESKITSLSDTTCKRLAKMVMYPHSRDFGKWKQEVAAYFYQVYRATFVKRGRRIPQNDVYKWWHEGAFGPNGELIPTYPEEVRIGMSSEKPISISPEELELRISRCLSVMVDEVTEPRPDWNRIEGKILSIVSEGDFY